MFCTYCNKLVSEKMAIRRSFCPYCGRRLFWFGIPDVDLSKPILQAILKRKNYLIKQRLSHIENFYYREKMSDIPFIEIQDALAINKDNCRAHFQLALYYVEQRRNDKAKDEFGEVLRLEPTNIDAHFHLANLAVSEEDYETTINECRQILNLEPKNLTALYNKAVAYYYQADYSQALLDFRIIQELEPENNDVLEAIKEISAKLN